MRLKIGLLFILVFSLGHAYAYQDSLDSRELNFGVLPMVSPIALFKRFAPLRNYISSELQLKVAIKTAKDFQEFDRRTGQRQFDLVFTAPHLALKALDSGRYEAVASMSKPLRAVLCVKDNSGYSTPAGLTGMRIGTPPEQAIVTMVGRSYMTEKKINAEYKPFHTHNAVLSALMADEVQGAFVASQIFTDAMEKGMPVKKIGESEQFPGIVILVAKDLQRDLKMQIANTFISMDRELAGQQVLGKILQPGYIASSRVNLERLRKYVADTEH